MENVRTNLNLYSLLLFNVRYRAEEVKYKISVSTVVNIYENSVFLQNSLIYSTTYVILLFTNHHPQQNFSFKVSHQQDSFS